MNSIVLYYYLNIIIIRMQFIGTSILAQTLYSHPRIQYANNTPTDLQKKRKITIAPNHFRRQGIKSLISTTLFCVACLMRRCSIGSAPPVSPSSTALGILYLGRPLSCMQTPRLPFLLLALLDFFLFALVSSIASAYLGLSPPWNWCLAGYMDTLPGRYLVLAARPPNSVKHLATRGCLRWPTGQIYFCWR